MKKLIVSMVTIGMLSIGCGGTEVVKPTVPTVEQGLYSKLDKHLQVYGPIAVRAAAITAWTLKPEIKSVLRIACVQSYKTIDNGNIAVSLAEVLKPIEKVSPFMGVALMFAMAIQEDLKISTNPEDINVIKSLIYNIGLDAGLNPDDFK